MRWIWLLLIACRHDEPTLQWFDVHVALPGTSAEQMARMTLAVETQLGTIAGVTTIRSESTSNLTSIFIGATQDVREPMHAAIVAAHRTWPPEILTPTAARRRPLVARLTVPVGRAEATAHKIEMLEGVTSVERCDPIDAPARYAIDVARLAAINATPADVYAAASHSLETMVAKGVTVADVIAKLPSVPTCRATTRAGEVALLEVYGDEVTSLAGFGTVLPPLVEGYGESGEVVITRAGERRVLVEHGPGAMLTIAAADPARLLDAAPAIVAKLGANALLVRGLATTSEKVVEIDRERAAELGVDVADLAATLALATDDGASISGMQLLAKGPLKVRSSRLGMVPLEDVVRTTEHGELREVLRVDLRRVVTVLAHEQVDVGALPTGVTATWSRTIER